LVLSVVEVQDLLDFNYAARRSQTADAANPRVSDPRKCGGSFGGRKPAVDEVPLIAAETSRPNKQFLDSQEAHSLDLSSSRNYCL
jgi:hypothetical protein